MTAGRASTASATDGTTPPCSFTPSTYRVGDDLRREPLEVRKATLASVLSKAGTWLRLNEHLEHDDGEVVFRHACKLGLKASCPSARTRPTVPAARPIGSR